jgi:acyl-CoA thioester hydrolase
MTEEHVSESRLRVRYAETDAMGIAHHAEYLCWYEVGRTDWIRRGGRDSGRSYRRLEQAGFFLPVVEVGSRHFRPARYDDELVVRTRLLQATRARIEFEYEVRRCLEEPLLCLGRTLHAVTGGDGRARRMPQPVLDWLLGRGGPDPASPDAAG